MDLIEVVTWVSAFCALLVGTSIVRSVLNEANPNEPKKTNYKNISIMASNLVNCKVSTRKEVLTDLYNDEEWTEAEVDELRGVVEGMLNTKIFLDRDKKDNKKGLQQV